MEILKTLLKKVLSPYKVLDFTEEYAFLISDSDSVCEGSNPSPAAKDKLTSFRLENLSTFFYLCGFAGF
jgi:hypothetical protein